MCRWTSQLLFRGLGREMGWTCWSVGLAGGGEGKADSGILGRGGRGSRLSG